MKPIIAILMSTYNGREYIEEQIESIINQTNKNWHLYIRDDGSTDSTVTILNKFEKVYPQITILKDKIKHRGIKGSFIYLLKECEASYYMFCDQDDVWLEDKIDISLYEIERFRHMDRPILVVSDLEVVDKDLNTIALSLWAQNKITNIVDDPSYLTVAPMYTGCTMMFNQAAKECMLNGSDSTYVIHDQSLALNTYRSRGKIIPIHRSLIKYRQHNNNVIGAQRTHTINLLKILKTSMSYYRSSHPILKTSVTYYLYKKALRFIKSLHRV